ncbi:SHOCT-like domain-containing protein [Thermus sp.]|uniref:SHOCT-like domain-containing protein n=1 Tax=Thermus sp. TaxID=275 RepID=UPI0028CDEF57|nr:hypothetical protein [Thermus sp.]MDT7909934.1 hypothetical protein [Thermus sp.]
MEDRRRILEMVREGVLSPEEALELLAVLEDREEGRAEEGLTPPLVRLVAQGAEVRVVGEKGLASPRAEGGEFRQEGEGYLLRLGLREKGRLWVPEGSPVRLEAKGSNLELSRVALSGQAHGCNLEGEELLGLDLRLVAGNLEAGLLLKEGRHGLDLKAANAELRFLPGSDLLLEVEARLSSPEVEGAWTRAPSGYRLGEGRGALRVRAFASNLEVEA